MSKYKLIKLYPGSPDLGTIAERGMGIKFTYPDGKVEGQTTSNRDDFNVLIESQPEYWQKVIEKEYEILSFKVPGNDHWRATLQSNGMYDGWSKAHAFTELQKGSWSIWSVKRLSDGEVFTLGDKVHLSNGNYYTSELKEFKIVQNGERGHLAKHRNAEFLKLGITSMHSSHTIFFYLADIVKTKQVLFVTKDGYKMFEGDKFFMIPKTLDAAPLEAVASEANITSITDKLTFRTLMMAEDYLLWNTQKFSMREVKDVMASYNLDIPLGFISTLKNIVKGR